MTEKIPIHSLVSGKDAKAPANIIRKKARSLLRKQARVDCWVIIRDFPLWVNQTAVVLPRNLSRRAQNRLAGQALGIAKRLERTVVACNAVGVVGIACEV